LLRIEWLKDLEWLKDEPFNKYPAVIYNKGGNDDFYKPDNATIIKLANVERDGHTYLNHIVTNYDSPCENTMDISTRVLKHD
jgi:hypothetical protein